MKLYHLTPNRNRSSIMTKGLLLRAYDGFKIKYDERIYVSNSKKNLAFDYVGFENVDVWEITTEQEIYRDLVSDDKGHFYLKNPISPKNIKLIKCF